MDDDHTQAFLQAAAATLAAGSSLSYMHYWEPGWLELIRHRLAFFKDNAAPFKILFLADLHYSRFVPLSLISDAIALGVAQKPDLILLGGDYVLFDMQLNFSAFSDVLPPLPNVRRHLPVTATTIALLVQRKIA